MFGNTATGNIDVIAAISLIGKNQPNGICPTALFGIIIKFHIAIIIAVHDGDIANALKNSFCLRAVIALRFAGQIGDKLFRPALRRLGPIRGNHRRHQRAVINMAARARANPLLPFGIGQIFDTLNGISRHPVTRGRNDTRPLRQAKPSIVRGA